MSISYAIKKDHFLGNHSFIPQGVLNKSLAYSERLSEEYFNVEEFEHPSNKSHKSKFNLLKVEEEDTFSFWQISDFGNGLRILNKVEKDDFEKINTSYDVMIRKCSAFEDRRGYDLYTEEDRCPITHLLTKYSTDFFTEDEKYIFVKSRYFSNKLEELKEELQHSLRRLSSKGIKTDAVSEHIKYKLSKCIKLNERLCKSKTYLKARSKYFDAEIKYFNPDARSHQVYRNGKFFRRWFNAENDEIATYLIGDVRSIDDGFDTYWRDGRQPTKKVNKLTSGQRLSKMFEVSKYISEFERKFNFECEFHVDINKSCLLNVDENEEEEFDGMTILSEEEIVRIVY
jgi:hypothetical protein